MTTPDDNKKTGSSVSDHAIFERMPGFIAIVHGLEHTFEYANPAYFELAGDRELIGLTVRQAFPELLGQGFYEALDDVYRTGTAFSASAMPIRLTGSDRQRYIDFVYQPVVDDEGETTSIYIAGHEVTAHLEAVQQAQRSERELQMLTDALPVLISYMDAEQRYQFNNKLYEEWFPRTREEIHGQTIRSVIGEKAYGVVQDKIERVLAGERFRFEQMMPYSTTSHRHIQVEYVPRKDESGTVEGWYALVQDVTKTKELEKQKDALRHELAHRIKNQLAVVQSLASQTLRHADSVADAQAALSSRLEALSRVQDILILGNWAGADISSIVENALTPYEDGRGRFEITGNGAALDSQQSLSLSLAIQELATNATKHGALSNDRGTVSIKWSSTPDGQFEFKWSESDGPTVVPPEKLGFGSKLIERMIAPSFNGQVSITYEPAGVRFTLVGNLKGSSTDS